MKNAYPDGWYVRIMFDELLDPSIETLTEIIDDEGVGTGTFEGSIADSHPVNLECIGLAGSMVPVDYDGYYSPAGNAITWPVGPSLVIKPNDPMLIATNTECRVTLNDNILDKNGEAVPAAQRGPYTFSVAPIEVVLIDPPDDPDGEHAVNATQIYFDNLYVQFNTTVYAKTAGGLFYNGACDDVDQSGLCDGNSQVEFKDDEHPTEGPGYCNSTFATCGSLADCGTGDTVCGKGFCNNGAFDTVCNVDTDCATGEWCESTYTYSYKPFGLSDAEFGIGPLNPVEVERSYTFQFAPGAMLYDRCGRATTINPTAEAQTLIHFTTNPFDYVNATIVAGETAAPVKKLKLSFTNVVGGGDAPGSPLPAAALDPSMWELTPLPVAAGGAALTKDQIQTVAVDFSGQILFRGHFAVNTDYTFTLKAGAVVNDFYGVPYTNPTDKVITWKTAAAITQTTTSPVDMGTVIKATPASPAGVQFNFNQSMNPTTLDATEFTVTDSAGNAVTMDAPAASSGGCGTTSSSCGIRVRKAGLAAGSYTFTLKAGATIVDAIGSTTYTQAADKVVHFTVEEAPAVEPIQCL